MDGIKLRIVVTAGVLPDDPEPELTRVWEWTNRDQDELEGGDKATARAKYIRIAGESREYAATLENPLELNWVRREWLWL